MVANLLPRLQQCTQAGVTTLATIALPVLIGSAGLAFDLNRGYQQRVINQRAADMAALGAGLAYKASSQVAVLQPTAENIGSINGVTSASVVATLLEDTPEAGAQSVQVTVTTPMPYLLARVLGLSGTFDVVSSSMASLTAGPPSYAPPCYLALDNSTTLDISSSPLVTDGGANINAPNCSIAALGSIWHDGTGVTTTDLISSNGSIKLAGGSNIYADDLYFAGSFNPPSYYPAGSEAIPTEDKWHQQAVTLVDPWAGDLELTSALNVFQSGNWPNTTPAAIAAPTMPTGSDVYFKHWEPAPVPGSYVDSSTSTIYMPQGTYNYRNYRANGGTKVVFADGSLITVSGTFDPGGGINFGASEVKIAGNLNLGWGNSMGQGSMHIGGNFTANNFTKGDGDLVVAGTSSFGGTTRFGDGEFKTNSLVLSGGTSLLFGDGNKVINGGINGLGGGTQIEFGDGNMQIGKGSSGDMNGYAIRLGGSTNLFMGDGMFIADGHIDTDGGSHIKFGATANHYINGNFHIEGAAIFGSGRYTINGSFLNGTGGATWPVTGPSGTSIGASIDGHSPGSYEMIGFDVTFLTKDGYTLAGGTSAWLEASDTSVSGAQIGEMLFTSMTTNQVNWGAGAASLMAGTTYFPNAVIEMNGGNNTGSPNDKCLTVIGYRIRAVAGAVAGSACPRMGDALGVSGDAGSASIRLIG